MFNQFNTFCKNAWLGQEPLWKVFWGLWLGGQIFIALFGYIFLIILSQFHDENPYQLIEEFTGPSFYAVLIVAIIQLSLQLFLIRCVWKSAWNVGNPLWGYLARIVMALFVLSFFAAVLS